MDWEAFYNNFRSPGFVAGYEIQNRLGGGAFGDVYKAKKQSIGKPYAIKFLKIEDDSQREAVERELSQVRHFAAIDHPNLVTIEDMGTVMGVPYLIMGYAGEDTLARRFKAGGLDSDSALLYFVQACRGVLALHDRRLVHFDLKPSNIFLKGDVARVGDYGLSKLLTDGRMTLSFGRGTPQYMAPEMLRNRADQRADLYSLGVILYESLAGELPFASDNPGGLVLREEDRPPAFPDGFPVAARPAVERCLRLSPDDRYGHVGELLDDIGQTARQGDSVRFDWKSTPVPRPPEPLEQAPRERPTPSSKNEELRQTAADLARASVEVARGMWDGLRKATDRDEGARRTAKPAAAGVSGPEPDPAFRAQREPSAAQSPGAARVQARRKVSGLVRGLQEARVARHERRAARARFAPSEVAMGPAGTVPVPPRVEGGAVGAAFSMVVLGLEVLASLVANLVGGAVRGFRSTVEAVMRGSGGLVARGLRLIGFVLIMIALGAAVMTVGMFFVDAIGAR